MLELTGWARDLLVSRGALVETGPAGAVRALLPPEVAATLGAAEWLSLKFSPGLGADDPGEWLDRLAHLLPPQAIVTGARLRRLLPLPPLDVPALLERELVIQNGIYRVVEDSPGRASYFLFTFQYAVESDERSLGAVTVGVNSSARSLVPQPETLLRAVAADLEQAPSFQLPAEALTGVYPAAARAAEIEARKLISGLEETSRRRLARDTERVQAYYQALLAQIEKRVARRAADPAAAEKERSRARATELDRDAKLEDLRRKYSLRIKLEPAAVLAVNLPVRHIAVRLVRKKEERLRSFHWNAVLRLLEPAMCEHCLGQAHPLFLCEKMHCLCRECWTSCPR
ncbi:MAG: hypothetical protein AAB225_31160, partial [Acidobacteriota bacterium]